MLESERIFFKKEQIGRIVHQGLRIGQKKKKQNKTRKFALLAPQAEDSNVAKSIKI